MASLTILECLGGRSVDEAAKPYTKKGRMNVFKQPVPLKDGAELLAIGRDVNGNKLIRIELRNGKKKSVQLDSSKTITLDDVVAGLDKSQIDHIMGSISEGLDESVEQVNEASVMKFSMLSKELQKVSNGAAKALNGKISTTFDGIHGIIIVIDIDDFKNRYDPKDLKKIASLKKVRWIEFGDDNSVSVGIDGFASEK